jgi:hypothetical protein
MSDSDEDFFPPKNPVLAATRKRERDKKIADEKKLAKEKLRSDKIAAKELRARELQTIKDLSKLEKEVAKEQKE